MPPKLCSSRPGWRTCTHCTPGYAFVSLEKDKARELAGPNQTISNCDFESFLESWFWFEVLLRVILSKILNIRNILYLKHHRVDKTECSVCNWMTRLIIHPRHRRSQDFVWGALIFLIKVDDFFQSSPLKTV